MSCVSSCAWPSPAGWSRSSASTTALRTTRVENNRDHGPICDASDRHARAVPTTDRVLLGPLTGGDLVGCVANPSLGSSSNRNRRPYVLQCSMAVALGSPAVASRGNALRRFRAQRPGPFPRRLASLINWPGLVPGLFFWAGAYAGSAPPARTIGEAVA